MHVKRKEYCVSFVADIVVVIMYMYNVHPCGVHFVSKKKIIGINSNLNIQIGHYR